MGGQLLEGVEFEWVGLTAAALDGDDYAKCSELREAHFRPALVLLRDRRGCLGLEALPVSSTLYVTDLRVTTSATGELAVLDVG